MWCQYEKFHRDLHLFAHQTTSVLNYKRNYEQWEEKIYTKVLEAIEKDFAKELATTPGNPNKVTDTLGVPMLLKMRREQGSENLTIWKPK